MIYILIPLSHKRILVQLGLLWDICRIPDFQKIFNDSVTLDLLGKIFS